jgi:hypothetical protein
MAIAELVPQYQAALERANEVRFKRAAFKRAIARREASVIEAIHEPPEWLLDARVRDFVLAIRGEGPYRVKHILLRANVPQNITFRQLVPDQRDRLIERLGQCSHAC